MEMTMELYKTYKGKAVARTGWGLVASILQLESEMSRILNNVAHEMAEKRHSEWVNALEKYHMDAK
jgi:hypothetical protein